MSVETETARKCEMIRQRIGELINGLSLTQTARALRVAGI
jgi:hypothetical protein